LTNDLSISCYYRLFCHRIFSNLSKILYFDVDTIVNSDISKLFNQNISNFYCAAVKDYGVYKTFPLMHPDFFSYIKNLGLKNIDKYFNSGVLLLNLDKIRKENLDEKLFSIAKQNNRYFNDQNVLNVVFNDKCLLISEEWNYQRSHCALPEDVSLDCKIIHFCYKYKPWNSSNMHHYDKWWEYAKSTPCYKTLKCDFDKISNINLPKKQTKRKITFLQSIFSVKNSTNKSHKELRVLGLKIKFRKHKKQ